MLSAKDGDTLGISDSPSTPAEAAGSELPVGANIVVVGRELIEQIGAPNLYDPTRRTS